MGKRRSRAGPIWGAAVVTVLVICVIWLRQAHSSTPDAAVLRQSTNAGCAGVLGAYGKHRSGMWLTVSATVVRVLPDSSGRLTHQRFIVRCRGGQTILVVNDVSVGQRAPVAIGDRVTARGVYVWNRLGGLVHFTHHATGAGPGGWILLRNHLYAAGTFGSPVEWRLVSGRAA